MAAPKYLETERQYRQIMMDVRNGVFSPVYLLMGAEPYYPDLICGEIIANALQDNERDFNQSIYYGLDSDAGKVASDARSYPMMSERRLVVLKDAQNMDTLEDLAPYVAEPMDSTVLVILMRGASADKRRALYKAAVKNGIVVESDQIRDYEVEGWVSSYYKSRGLDISREAAAMVAECSGTDLGKIVLETEKLLKNLPEGTTSVNAGDIEDNFGISRQYSIFELTKELSSRNSAKALKIAAYVGAANRFAMPAAIAALYAHFYKVLKYEAAMKKNPGMSPGERAKVLGVSPYFLREYDTAARNYPMDRCRKIAALLETYDLRSKSGGAGEASDGEMLMELVSKILA